MNALQQVSCMTKKHAEELGAAEVCKATDAMTRELQIQAEACVKTVSMVHEVFQEDWFLKGAHQSFVHGFVCIHAASEFHKLFVRNLQLIQF
jgi:hypothetical protein